MAPKKRIFAELGSVANRSGSYRAEFNVREDQRLHHIDGPHRGKQQRIPGDLNVIRVAAPADALREEQRRSV